MADNLEPQDIKDKKDIDSFKSEDGKSKYVNYERFQEVYGKYKTLEEEIAKIKQSTEEEKARLEQEKKDKEKAIEDEKKKSLSSTELFQQELIQLKLELLKEKITKANPEFDDVLKDIKVSSEEQLLTILQPLIKLKEKYSGSVDEEASKKAKLLIEQHKVTLKGEKQESNPAEKWKEEMRKKGWL